MQLKDAIKLRLDAIMEEKEKSSKYKVSCDAGLNPSLLNDFYRDKISYPRVDTMFFICDGLEITLGEFFNDPLFDRENIEIKDSKD